MLSEEVCQRFLQNPHQNPKTGGKLLPFRGLHNHYIDECIDNGLEDKVGVMLLTIPMKELYDKHFTQQPLFTEEELDNLFDKPLEDKWDISYGSDSYKRVKLQ